jgi:hypothetical protein
MKYKEVVINDQHGGFNLSYAGTMAYAKLKKIPVFAFVLGRKPDGGLDLTKLLPYSPSRDERSDPFCVHYYKTSNPEDKAHFCPRDIPRDDPALVKVVRKLKTKAGGKYASLKIVKIPADVAWKIDEYDGKEWVAEIHRVWV